MEVNGKNFIAFLIVRLTSYLVYLEIWRSPCKNTDRRSFSQKNLVVFAPPSVSAHTHLQGFDGRYN